MAKLGRALFSLSVFSVSAFAGSPSPCNPQGLDLSCHRNGGVTRGLKVSLTFDDGPDPNFTSKVVAALDSQRVPATFFISGDRFGPPDVNDVPPSRLSGDSSRHPYDPQLVKWVMEERAHGYRIGSHTYQHIAHVVDYGVNRDGVDKDIANLRRANRPPLDALFDKPFVVRLPYGSCWFPEKNPVKKAQCEKVMAELHRQNAIHVGWNIDSRDWETLHHAGPGGEAIPESSAEHVERVMRTVAREACEGRGGVILFHDVQESTASNLGCYITELKQAGYEFVGLEDPSLRSSPETRLKVLDPGPNSELLRRLQSTQRIPLPSLLFPGASH